MHEDYVYLISTTPFPHLPLPVHPITSQIHDLVFDYHGFTRKTD